APNVALALLAARLDLDPASPTYLTQILDGVYTNPDPRAYPLSGYSYLIAPTSTQSPFNTAKGHPLGDFAYYPPCAAQHRATILAYAPMPVNLVQAGLDQIRRIPGVDPTTITIAGCDNPTFSPDGTDLLASTVPFPEPCDRVGPQQCGSSGGGTQPTVTALSDITVGPFDPNGPPTQPSLVNATATVTPTSGTGTPTGSVLFEDAGIAFGGPVPLIDGRARLTTTGFGPGTHLLSAVYLGDATFASSSSPMIAIPIDGPAYSSQTLTTDIAAGALVLSVTDTTVTLPEPQLTADGSLLPHRSA